MDEVIGEKMDPRGIVRYSVTIREVVKDVVQERCFYIGVESPHKTPVKDGYEKAVAMARCVFGGNWDKVDRILVARLG